MEEPILIGREYILVYQPIVRRRRTSNVFWSTGLVKMSAQRWAEAILLFCRHLILRDLWYGVI